MNIARLSTTVAALSILMNCTSGGGENSASRATFDDLEMQFDELDAIIDFGSSTEFAPEDLPALGSATYDSVIQFTIDGDTPSDPDLEILGDMEIRADFGAQTDTISGHADNFSDSEGGFYVGRVDISNGLIRRDNDPDTAAFDADFDGSLVDNNSDQFVLDSIIVGEFHGTNYEYIGGTVRGTLTTPDGVLEINDGLDRFNDTVSNADGEAVFFGER